jgi:hypothetical protein
MQEAWDTPDADPTGMIGRFLRLLRERDATIARLAQERDYFHAECDRLLEEAAKALRERDPALATRDAAIGKRTDR